MSYVDSHLQAGEQILYRINRGRAWYDYLWAFVSFLLLTPLVLSIYIFGMTLTVRVIAASLPASPEGELITALVALALLAFMPVLAVISQGVEFVAFWLTDVALTDRRILGRALGRNRLWLRTFDIPAQDVAKVHRFRLSSLVAIERKSTRRAAVLGPFKDFKGFIARCEQRE